MEALLESRRTQQHLHSVYQQVDQAIETARRMQADLLPRTLPSLETFRFEVFHRAGRPVAAGWYDALCLDEDHVACHVGQVMGAGLVAGLLNLYLRQAIRTKEIRGHEYRLIPPDEVLATLNQGLLRLQLPESPFVGMVYVLGNIRTGLISFAKAGPLALVHVPSAGEPTLWHGSGGFLGLCPDVFPAQSRLLRPEDRLLLCGDGAGMEDADALIDCAGRHRTAALGRLVEWIGQDRMARSEPPEGVTVLGMEWRCGT